MLIDVFESTDKKIRLPPPKKFEREKLQYWFTHLLTSLDCYIWLFAEATVPPELIFNSGNLSVIDLTI